MAILGIHVKFLWGGTGYTKKKSAKNLQKSKIFFNSQASNLIHFGELATVVNMEELPVFTRFKLLVVFRISSNSCPWKLGKPSCCMDGFVRLDVGWKCWYRIKWLGLMGY